jgi:Ni2+-binding GTPase involved in maturation of urease and hydrogenase
MFPTLMSVTKEVLRLRTPSEKTKVLLTKTGCHMADDEMWDAVCDSLKTSTLQVLNLLGLEAPSANAARVPDAALVTC